MAFGHDNGLFDDIEGLYRLAIINEKIVAITGILPVKKSGFSGYEVAYTVTHPDHRGKGLITRMLKELIDDLPDDGVPVFASCWRIQGDINLHHAMDTLGFELLHKARINYIFPYYKECINCPRAQIKCTCSEDLYILCRGESL